MVRFRSFLCSVISWLQLGVRLDRLAVSGSRARLRKSSAKHFRHLGGATVLRGPMGFGKSSRMHTAKILRLSMDLPIVIEIVDSEAKINAFLPALEEMMSGGMVTLERVQVIEYRHVTRENDE